VEDEPFLAFLGGRLDDGDLGADAVDIVDDEAFRQFDDADRAAHQRKKGFGAGAVVTEDAAGGPVLVGIEIAHIVMEIADQPGLRLCLSRRAQVFRNSGRKMSQSAPRPGWHFHTIGEAMDASEKSRVT